MSLKYKFLKIFLKAEINAVVGQEITFELWDWDPGFPGVENDDFLGRW